MSQVQKQDKLKVRRKEPKKQFTAPTEHLILTGSRKNITSMPQKVKFTNIVIMVKK
jgi:hypothetical protein